MKTPFFSDTSLPCGKPALGSCCKGGWSSFAGQPSLYPCRLRNCVRLPWSPRCHPGPQTRAAAEGPLLREDTKPSAQNWFPHSLSSPTRHPSDECGAPSTAHSSAACHGVRGPSPKDVKALKDGMETGGYGITGGGAVGGAVGGRWEVQSPGRPSSVTCHKHGGPHRAVTAPQYKCGHASDSLAAFTDFLWQFLTEHFLLH